MTKNQIIAAYEAGDLDKVEFFELALEADMTLDEIERHLSLNEIEECVEQPGGTSYASADKAGISANADRERS